jgi:hypothetical protein
MHKIPASHESYGGYLIFWRKTLAENFSGKLQRKTSAENIGGKLLQKTLAPHRFRWVYRI